MTSSIDIPLHGRSVNIVRRCRDDLCDVLHSKFGCVAVINDVDSDGAMTIAQQQSSTDEQIPRFAVKLPSGVQVSVWKADLTRFKADAVVNAANTQLQHYGGLAAALSLAGGPQIQKDSNDYIRRHGELKTGDAILTNAGGLKCNHIIHAVGPQVPASKSKSDISQATPLLKKATQSILEIVQKHTLQSVAIPAISSGIFNYPLTLCADIIVSTVKEYCSQPHYHKHLPQEIFLVNHDEPSVAEMTRACQQILPSHKTKTYSQVAVGRRNDVKASESPLMIGNVCLFLKKGKIEEQRTDVIVNTACKSRDLSKGNISTALLRKAGHEIQQEMYKVSPTGLVIITKAYNLHCQSVFHTFCAVKTNDAGEQEAAKKILFSSVKECLWLAATRHYKSIAFPAIGTGLLGFLPNEVAEIMLKAVTEFSNLVQTKIEVHIVIFPSDNNTFQAFDEQLRNLKDRVSQPSFELAVKTTDGFSGMKAPPPRITLSGRSEDETREAQRWLQNLLFDSEGTVVICNNFVLHFGKEEHQRLSNLIKNGVMIEEFYEKGRGGIIITGDSKENVGIAAVKVEALLRKTQMEFVNNENKEITKMLFENKGFAREMLHFASKEYSDRMSLFRTLNLRMSKVEKVENPALEKLFQLKKSQLNVSSSRTMFQCIPAQFCEMVSCVGFHAEFAPPEDPAFGEGIYFVNTVEKAMEMWKGQNEEFVYFVEAEVLTGFSSPGKPGLILPPAAGPNLRYQSVSGGADISVIFSGYQALPRYIITCKAY